MCFSRIFLRFPSLSISLLPFFCLSSLSFYFWATGTPIGNKLIVLGTPSSNYVYTSRMHSLLSSSFPHKLASEPRLIWTLWLHESFFEFRLVSDKLLLFDPHFPLSSLPSLMQKKPGIARFESSLPSSFRLITAQLYISDCLLFELPS